MSRVLVTSHGILRNESNIFVPNGIYIPFKNPVFGIISAEILRISIPAQLPALLPATLIATDSGGASVNFNTGTYFCNSFADLAAKFKSYLAIIDPVYDVTYDTNINKISIGKAGNWKINFSASPYIASCLGFESREYTENGMKAGNTHPNFAHGIKFIYISILEFAPDVDQYLIQTLGTNVEMHCVAAIPFVYGQDDYYYEFSSQNSVTFNYSESFNLSGITPVFYYQTREDPNFYMFPFFGQDYLIEINFGKI